MDYSTFTTLLSCNDWHLRELSLPKSTLYSYVERVRRSERILHLKYLKPLGIGLVFAIKRDPEIARALLVHQGSRIKTHHLKDIGIPGDRFVHTITVLPKNRVLVTWHKPPGISIEYDGFDEVYEGYMVPVQNCVGKTTPKPDPELIDVLGSRLRQLLRIPELKLRMPALGYVIISMMDTNPLLSLRDMRRIVYAARARDLGSEEDALLRVKYLLRYYRKLSHHNVVGRVYVYGAEAGTRLVVSVHSECSETLYGILAATRSASYVYISKEKAVAGVYLPCGSGMDEPLKLLHKLCPETEIHYRLRTFMWPFPYEMYDPITNKWVTNPNEGFLKLLDKLQLIIKAKHH